MKKINLAIEKRFSEELPEPYRQKALDNLRNYPLNDDYYESIREIEEENLGYVLSHAFKWSDTPEGLQFWTMVYFVIIHSGPEKLNDLIKGFDWGGWTVLVYPDYFQVGCTKFDWEDIKRIQTGAKELVDGTSLTLVEDFVKVAHRYFKNDHINGLIEEIKNALRGAKAIQAEKLDPAAKELLG